jgi:hypothetical protein
MPRVGTVVSQCDDGHSQSQNEYATTLGRFAPFFDDRNEGRGGGKNRYDTPERYQVSMNYYRTASDGSRVGSHQGVESARVYDNTLIILRLRQWCK